MVYTECLFLYVHPGKLTWNLKITCLKREIIFQNSIFGFHVNFQGCIILQPSEKWSAQSHPAPNRSQRFSRPEATPWHTLRAAVGAKALEWKNTTILPSLFLGVVSGGGKQYVKTPFLQARVFAAFLLLFHWLPGYLLLDRWQVAGARGRCTS